MRLELSLMGKYMKITLSLELICWCIGLNTPQPEESGNELTVDNTWGSKFQDVFQNITFYSCLQGVGCTEAEFQKKWEV